MSLTTITSVTEAAESYDLTTLDVVKDELGVTDNSKNAALARYISSASAAAAQYCGRVFPAESVRDEFRYRSEGQFLTSQIEKLQLSRYPIVSMMSVSENGTVLVEDDDFTVDAAAGQLLRLSGGCPRCWSGFPVTVDYVGGYEDIPPDVADAVVRMVTRRYQAKGRDPNLKQQDIPGVLSQSWWIATGSESGNMSPDISDVLDNYRVPVIS